RLSGVGSLRPALGVLDEHVGVKTIAIASIESSELNHILPPQPHSRLMIGAGWRVSRYVEQRGRGQGVTNGGIVGLVTVIRKCREPTRDDVVVQKSRSDNRQRVACQEIVGIDELKGIPRRASQALIDGIGLTAIRA